MEPITWAVLLTLVANSAIEKVVDEVGDGVIASAKHLLSLLRQRSPKMAQRLLAAGASDSGEPIVIDAEIIEEVRRVANDDPEVQAAVEATEAAVAADPQGLKNLTKLADKIGVVNLGNVQNQTINQTF